MSKLINTRRKQGSSFRYLGTCMRLKGILMILCMLLISQISLSQPAGYGYGKRITIAAAEVVGGSPLANFPVMVRLMGAEADNDLRTTLNGGHVESASGYDIIFTSDPAGTVVMDHQIEFFDGVSGEYVAWVHIPSLSNSLDTDFYMWYGNCAISTNPSTTDVWNTDFNATYFLHNDFGDSTGNGNTGTNGGSTDASPGLIGDGQAFASATNQHIQVPTASISAGRGTVSLWAYATSFSSNHHYLFGHTTLPSFNNRIQIYTNDVTGLLDLGLGGSHNTALGIYDLNTDEWYYITLTWDGANYVVYVNGTAQASGTYTGLGALHGFADIGNNGLATTRNEPWAGDLDHVRLSDEAFSAEWIQTEYNNQRESSTFMTVSGELPSRTFYSLASGDWDSNTSWSLTSDGSSGAVGVGTWPGRNDNIVIQNGHVITINSTDDNHACGISANNLGRPNVGNGADPFTGSGDPMFYHTGDIIISNGGTLSTSEELMIEGYTLVDDGGTLSSTDDVINLGYLEFSETATFETSDDLILTGNSTTIMDNTSQGDDDLYIEWSDATLCGNGDFNIGNGGPDPAIVYFNGATDAQICSDFEVTCSSTCAGAPATGSGTFISGNTGPGGVGDASSLELWLRANDLGLSDGDPVTSWLDVSGNSLTASADGGPGTEPTFEANTVNTNLPSISFDGGDYLNLSQPAGLDFIPGTDSWSLFIVYNVPNLTATGTFISKADGIGGNRTYQYTMDVNGGNYTFTSFIGGDWQTGNILNTGDWVVSSHSNNTTVRNSWTNEGANITNDNIGTNTTGSVDVLIGARRQTAPSTGFGFPLTGSIAEIAMYSGEMTEAQRIIITNSLAAKYDMALSANDVYTEDDNGFDFDVIGIGQASDGTRHIDSRGRGVARIWSPSDLDNNEYLMIGHDNTALHSTTSDLSEVDGTVIQQRLSRVWAVSETGDVGTVSISIDFSSIDGSPIGSNLRLLLDRDGDFSTNDVVPIEGSVSGGIAIFSNVDFQDGDRFTLGNTDISQPLPVELTAFAAKPAGNRVEISWETATELNNEYFTIERSRDGNNWTEVVEVPGAGDSQQALTYQAFDDFPLLGSSYYRLKQTDFNGQYSYSSVVFVWFDQIGAALKVFPNPSDGHFFVETGIELKPDQITLYNLVGKLVPARILTGRNRTLVDLSDLPNGLYLLRVVEGDGTTSVSRLRKE